MCCHDFTNDYRAIDLSKWVATIDRITRALYKREMKPTDLDADLVNLTYDWFEKSTNTLANPRPTEPNREEKIKGAERLREHLYKFSGAKTYQQLVEMNKLLVDDDGKIRSLSEFKRKVNAVHKLYNQSYLETEYITAKLSAGKVGKWARFMESKRLFPNLKYRTRGDSKVRDSHRKLEGLILPVDHPFWRKNAPLNGFRDRCFLQQTREKAASKAPADVADPGFQNNVYFDGQVFDEQEHPYFTISKEDAKLVYKNLEAIKKENGKAKK